MRNSKLIVASAAMLLAALTLPAGADWEQGTAAFKAGNYAAAVQQFQAVVDKQPDWPGGHYMLGQTLLKLKRNREAVAALERANELQPGNAGYQMVLGKAYVDTARYSDAARVLGAINTSGLSKAQQTALNQMLALAQNKSGQSGAALQTLAKAARANPSDASVQFQYGTAAFSAGDTAAAVAALEKAVSLKPTPDKQEVYVKALIRRAREVQGSSKLSLYQKASSTAQSMANANPSYDNLLLLGETQLGAKQYATATDTLNKAAAKNSSDWYPQYYLGQAHTATASYAAAKSSLELALTKTSSASNQRLIHSQLGFVYEKQKDYAKAKEAYRRAGNSAAVRRVEENEEIAKFNTDVEEQNQRIEELEAEKRALEEQLKELPGGPPPLR